MFFELVWSEIIGGTGRTGEGGAAVNNERTESNYIGSPGGVVKGETACD